MKNLLYETKQSELNRGLLKLFSGEIKNTPDYHVKSSLGEEKFPGNCMATKEHTSGLSGSLTIKRVQLVPGIEYKKFRFKRPLPLIGDDFEILKQVLTETPGYDFIPSSNFFSRFRKEIIFLALSISGTLIASKNFNEVLNWTGAILAVMTFLSLIIRIPSINSFVGYHIDKTRYYTRLKKDIIRSGTYREFQTLRYQRKWRLY